MRHKRLLLGLPRFEMTSKFVPNQHLTAMGMETAFAAPRADFTGISSHGELFIGLVIHKAFVHVDEEGTEATAATAVVMATAGMPAVPTPMIVDRPFVFAIRDNVTGSILFMGRVADPRGTTGQ